MKKVPKHAVLTNEHVITVDQNGTGRVLRRTLLLGKIESIVDLWQLGQRTGVTHFWPMGTLTDFSALNRYDDSYNVFFSYADEEKKVPKFGSIWRKKDRGHRVLVGYVGRGDWQQWRIEKPIDTLATIDYIERSSGIDVQWSFGHMGFNLVKTLHEKNLERLEDSKFNLHGLPFNKAARDVIFKKPLPSGSAGLYLHHYDKNSAYLSAFRGGKLGLGDPIHRTEDIDPAYPGIYRVEVLLAPAPFDGVGLPRIINTEWVTMDVLNYAVEQGYKVRVQEAWQFVESGRILDKWASRLWGARTLLKNHSADYPYDVARQNAYRTIKDIACIGVGRFASKKIVGAGFSLSRPNWWADGVGRARQTLCCNLKKLADKGYTPYLVFNDGLFFLSEDSNPQTAVPGILDREGELGGFKHEYTVQVNDVIEEAFNELKPAKLLEFLHDVSEMEGTEGE
jgi:hypothetical protein